MADDLQVVLSDVQRAEWDAVSKEVPPSAKAGELILPGGVVLRMGGEYQRMNESFRNLGSGLALASLLVILADGRLVPLVI